MTYENLVQHLSKETTFDSLSISILVWDLHEAGLLETQKYCISGSAAKKLVLMQKEWRLAGWRQSFEYFMFTYDFPYNPGDSAGRARAVELMHKYSEAEPDIDRVRHFCSDLELKITNVQSSACERPSEKPMTLSFEHLNQMLWRAAAGKRHRRPEWGGSDLIFRAAPSGGSRQPIDTYIFVNEVDGMEPGTYYFDFQRNVICRIRNSQSIEEIRLTFPGLTSRCEFSPNVVIAWAAEAQRNMYRYREPRTYRTLFLDAGHLIENFHISAASLGRPFHIHYFANVQEFMKRTNSSVNSSVFLAAMAIA